jgi:hypothetical protein
VDVLEAAADLEPVAVAEGLLEPVGVLEVVTVADGDLDAVVVRVGVADPDVVLDTDGDPELVLVAVTERVSILLPVLVLEAVVVRLEDGLPVDVLEAVDVRLLVVDALVVLDESADCVDDFDGTDDRVDRAEREADRVAVAVKVLNAATAANSRPSGYSVLYTKEDTSFPVSSFGNNGGVSP